MKKVLYLSLACLLISLSIKAQSEISDWKSISKEEIVSEKNAIKETKDDPTLSLKTDEHISAMTFDETTFVFGKVKSGEIVKNVFEFTNTGSEPLIISNAKGSCGCTVPEFPKEPILPGETGKLLVVFNTKGKNGMHTKKVTITANTDPSNTYLTIKGEVIKEKKETDKVKKLTQASSKNADIDPSLFSVFPNPSSERISVAMKGHEGKTAIIEIFNTSGILVDAMEISEINKPRYDFDISQYELGTYTATMKVEGKMRIAKQFIVLR